MSKKMGLGGGIIFIAFWSLITLTFDGLIVVNAYRQIRATGYEQTLGRVTHSEVTVHRDNDGDNTYGVDVRYSYQVDNIEHEGVRYRYGQWNSSGGSSRKIVNSLPVGKEVDVHYNPVDPADSVLVVGLQGADLFLALFLTPFNAVMLAGWYFGLRRLIRPLGRREAGGAKITRRGFQVRVQLRPSSPFGCALVAAGATAFGMTFVVAFGFGFDAPLIVAQVAWCIVLGAAGLAFVWSLWPGTSKASRLVIDEVSGMLTLPCTCGRQTPMEISANSIERIEVEEIAEDSRDETDLTQGTVLVQLVLSGSGGDDTERREPLISLRDEQTAESLAQWLREELAGVGRR